MKSAYLQGTASDDIRHAQLRQGGVDVHQLRHTVIGHSKALRDVPEVQCQLHFAHICTYVQKAAS